MENFVKKVISACGEKGDLPKFAEKLAKVESWDHLKPAIDQGLVSLSPELHTIGWVYLLSLKDPNENPEVFFHQASILLSNANPIQVRYAPSKFVFIAKNFREIAVALEFPKRAIRPLENAVRVLQCGYPGLLTPCHSMYLQVCLLAKCYRRALRILELHVSDVQPQETALEPVDVLTFFYYGGMIFTGVKNWKSAMHYYEMSFTSPASTISAVAVASFKRYILVSLMERGKLPVMPSYMPRAITRDLRHICDNYLEFERGFRTGNPQELMQLMEKHHNELEADSNLGLAQQCVNALYRQNIQKLTETYLTLSLADIAEETSLGTPEIAEQRVLQMIEDKQIFAVISQKDGMVSFIDDPEEYDTVGMTKQLDEDVNTFIRIQKMTEAAQKEIERSPEYLQKLDMGPSGAMELGGFMDDFDAIPEGMIDEASYA